MSGALTTTTTPSLLAGQERGLLSALDVQFATRLGELYGEASPEVLWGLAVACRQEANGHVCADLPRLESEGLLAEAEGEVRSFAVLPEGSDLEGWLRALRGSRLIGGSLEAGPAAQPTPLILDERGRLYLSRSFVAQGALAEAVRLRARRADLPIDWSLAEAGIDRLSSPSGAGGGGREADAEPDWTRLAMRVGLARPLSIVTGGPGTGKTTLVVRLIALLIEQRLAQNQPIPSVRLLAPTGKAAAAMTAAFLRQRETLDVSADVRGALPTNAETIHRALLGQMRRDALGRPHSTSLGAEIVVVDEASMVDLDLMRQLFTTCESAERIVLLGDPDQLASVDSGAVLAELCAVRAEPPSTPDFEARSEAKKSVHPSLSDSIVTLRESHRFTSSGGIGLLAEAIRLGDADLALSLLEDPKLPEVERSEVDSVAGVRARLVESARQIQHEIQSVDSLGAKLERLSSRRVLCAHRGGPLGVDALCDVLDEAAAQVRNTTSRSGWWRGRLLLVTRNAPDQDLWNGDVGLVEETPRGLRALFAAPGGGVRTLSVGRLPAYESAIAISVHKSQGSEFDFVDLVLGRTASRLVTRELLYTGVTRARQRLCIHASADAIRDALARRVQRDSGLAELLRAKP